MSHESTQQRQNFGESLQVLGWPLAFADLTLEEQLTWLDAFGEDQRIRLRAHCRDFVEFYAVALRLEEILATQQGLGIDEALRAYLHEKRIPG